MDHNWRLVRTSMNRVVGAWLHGSADPIPQRAPIRPVELLLLIAAACASILIHATFRVHGFGEPDAARLAVQAVTWFANGEPVTSYTLRVSPLYLLGLEFLLHAGVALTSLPAVMNLFNVFVSGLVLVPLYLLFRRLAGPRIATIACLLFFVTPGFWVSGLYGMPHLPSFTCFVTAMLLYAIAIDSSGTRHGALIGAAALCMVVALQLKADLILCSAALPVLAFALGRATRRHLVEAVVVPAIALAATVGLSARLFPRIGSLSGETGAWSEQFPFTLQALTDFSNRLVLLRTGGPVLLAVALISCAVLLRRAPHRMLSWFALSWALPPALWWGLRLSNSARHMMASFAAVAFIAAVGIVQLSPRRWGRGAPWVICALLIVANYFSGSKDLSGMVPPTQLHRAIAELHLAVESHHDEGRAFAATGNRSMGLATGTRPYLQWELFATGRPFGFVGRSVMDWWETTLEGAEGLTDTLCLVYAFEPFVVDPVDRWEIWTRDSKLRAFVYEEVPTSETTVRFDIAQACDVHIAVYDLEDRLIATLEDGRLPAGTHQASWDGRDGSGKRQPVGIYVYKMQLGDRTESHRVMLQFSRKPYYPSSNVRPRIR